MRDRWRRFAPRLYRRLRLDRLESIFERSSAQMILVIAAVAMTAIFVLFAMTLYAARLDAGNAARKATGNLAMAVSRQIERDIEMLDLSLQDLVQEAGNTSLYNLPREIYRDILFDKAAEARGNGALLLIDASGHLAEQAGTQSVVPIDFSKEEFFRVHTGRTDAGLYVSGPFVSLVDGEASVALSRRVMREGVFAGVGVATIRLSWIQAFFKTLDLGGAGSVTLMSQNGQVLVREPFVAGAVGMRIVDPTLRRSIDPKGPDQFEAASLIDGIVRLFSCNPIEHYPMIVIVGESLSDIYATWWRRAATTGLAMLLFGSVMLALIAALQVALRHRVRAEAALETLARTDKLTGLANRRHFDESLDREWERARLSQQPLALLLLDIDHFKGFNDLFGHQGGDAVLAAIAACIAGGARWPADLVARYGGEEFAVLLPNSTAADALAVARQIEQAVRVLHQPHPRSPTQYLTVSIGAVAMTPTAGQKPDRLVRGADLSLYEAKRSGRNQIVLWAERLAA